ncbi:FUSC family protein [Frondihabitans cladoniiphilus]|uniref:Integral membrane bound transporter domain-containing protein n=1 Tax=Frondihabitans cladoniiphilus TaxID=715785 RepID=A0ABP8VR03_9MICO
MLRPVSALVSRLRQPSRVPLLQVGKTSLAVVAAWVASVLLVHQSLPIFAAIAALLVVQPSINQSFGRGLERSAGVVMGVALAYVIAALLGHAHTWIVLIAVILALLIAWAAKLTPTSTTQVPISAMLVLSVGLVTPGYAFDRIVETVIGAIIALLVNALIAPPVLLGPVHLAVGRLARDSASALDDLAAALSSPTSGPELDAMLTRARALRGLQAKAAAAVKAGEESLTLNPRASRQRRILEADRRLLGPLSNLVHRIVAMTRTLRDNYDPELVGEPVVRDIADQLQRAAHDVRLLVHDTEEAAAADEVPAGEVPPGADGVRHGARVRDEPALTAPLEVVRPDPEHWILIGSLLEDLRRMREEIVGESA